MKHIFILQMTIYSKTVDIKYHGAVGYYFGEVGDLCISHFIPGL